MADIVREAACACGQLGIACRGEPAKVSLCHCLDCQRRTGSTYGIAAFYDSSAVTPRGGFAGWRRSAENGHAVDFRFCPQCGTTVFWEPARMPGLVAVAVGAFADPGFPAPSQQVWPERRHPWVRLPF